MTTPPGTGDPAAEIQRLLDSLTAHVAEDEAAARTDLDAPDDAQRYSDNDQWGEPLAWLMDADRVLREAEA